MHVESIRVNCAADYTPEQIEAWAGPKRPEHYVDAMSHGEVMFVAESDDQIVGFAALNGDEIKAVYVSPRSIRQGIGQSLLQTIETHAIRSGLSRTRLNSTITAIRFYEAHGYTRGEQTIHRMKGVDIPCISMSKELR